VLKTQICVTRPQCVNILLQSQTTDLLIHIPRSCFRDW